MASNKVVITKCLECANWSPADSYGGGVYCDELAKKLSDDIELFIPDECPLLAKAADALKPSHNSDYNAIKAAVEYAEINISNITPSAENRTDINMSNIKYHTGV